MFLRLTDYLACPRCGAGHGLILLAERVENQSVLAGQLGCPACRTNYRVDNGVADFGAGEAEPVPAEAEQDAVSLAAMLGVTEGPALLAVVGEWLETPARLAALLDEVEIIVVQQTRTVRAAQPRVSRLRATAGIPLRSGVAHGVVLAARSQAALSEAVRVCRLAARVVLLGHAVEPRVLETHGLRVIAQQGDTVVCVRQQ